MSASKSVAATAIPELPFARFAGEFAASRIAVAALLVALLLALAAVFAPWITPQNPYDLAQLNILDSRLPPGSMSSSGMTYWLGTDGQGRDMLSAIIYGLRISLGVGIGSALIAGVVGSVLGLLAAYAGGKIDAALMRLVDLQLSFPSILVALMIIAGFGKGVMNVLLALVIVEWAYYARAIRASAPWSRGGGNISRPRNVSPCRARASCCAISCPTACRRSSSSPRCRSRRQSCSKPRSRSSASACPSPSPRSACSSPTATRYMLSGQYWITFFPGIALLIAVVSFTLVGDRLRIVLNPRLRR